MSLLSAHNKNCTDRTPFDRNRVPPRQNIFLMPLIWAGCRFLTRGCGLRIRRTGMKGVKPPYLVLCNHLSWTDFYVTPLALFPHRANYVSETEGFEFWGEELYRQLGCLGTRKYIADAALVKNIRRVIARGDIMVIFPEGRFANVGTSSELPRSVGKLAKKLGVPVVGFKMQGDYLQSPIWNPKKRWQARLEAELKLLIPADELAVMTADEVQSRISEFLTYDEYAYQLERGMRITAPFRAEGLHKVLYRCPECGGEFTMRSERAELYCEECGLRVTMNELGQLTRDGTLYRFGHIPDWYEWERDCVRDEIDRGLYGVDTLVHIETLPGTKGFFDCGEGRLLHDKSGFSLTFTEYGEGAEKTLRFPAISMTSLHTEYNYRDWGECITLSVPDCTYFIFPRGSGFNPTKLQFATEELYARAVREIKRGNAEE